MYRTRSDERGPAMDGDLDGKAAQSVAGEWDSEEQALAHGHQDAQADGSAADYQAALRAKNAQIAELEGRVASATKTAEATRCTERGNREAQAADGRRARGVRAEGGRCPLREGRKGTARRARRRRGGAGRCRAMTLRGRGAHFTKDFTNICGRCHGLGARRHRRRQ